MIARRIALLTLGIALAGCAPATLVAPSSQMKKADGAKIASVIMVSYQREKPSSPLAITEGATSFRVHQELKARGINGNFWRVASEGEMASVQAVARKSGATHLITVAAPQALVKKWTYASGSTLEVPQIYDLMVEVLDAGSLAQVWRFSVTVDKSGFAQTDKAIGQMIVERMKQDGLL